MTDLKLENAQLKQNLIDMNSKLNKLQFEYDCLKQSEDEITGYYHTQLSKNKELMVALKLIKKDSNTLNKTVDRIYNIIK